MDGRILCGYFRRLLDLDGKPLHATLGGITSNTWSLRIVRPRYKNPFPFISDSRFSANSFGT